MWHFTCGPTFLWSWGVRQVCVRLFKEALYPLGKGKAEPRRIAQIDDCPCVTTMDHGNFLTQKLSYDFFFFWFNGYKFPSIWWMKRPDIFTQMRGLNNWITLSTQTCQNVLNKYKLSMHVVFCCFLNLPPIFLSGVWKGIYFEKSVLWWTCLIWSVISFGHLYLSGVWLGVASRT